MSGHKKFLEIVSHILHKGVAVLSWLCNQWTTILSVGRSTFIKYKPLTLKILIPLFIIVVGYVSCSISQKQISKNLQDIFAISDEIRGFYADKPDYWGLNSDFVIKNNVIPAKYIRGNKIVLDNGTEILIGSGDKAETVMPLSQSFDVVMPQLNKAQCMSYAEATLSQENLLKLLGIRIVNSSGNYSFSWGGAKSLPVQKYATKNLCTDSKNIVIWSIK